MKLKPWILVIVFFINISLTAQQPPPPGDGGDGSLVKDVPEMSLNFNSWLIIAGIGLILFTINKQRIES